MKDKKNGVALVLSPDRDPLLNAADLDKTLFDNALGGLDPQTCRYPRLPQLSVKEKCCGHARNQEQYSRANHPNQMFFHNCVYYTQLSGRGKSRSSSGRPGTGNSDQNDASHKAQPGECSLGREAAPQSRS